MFYDLNDKISSIFNGMVTLVVLIAVISFYGCTVDSPDSDSGGSNPNPSGNGSGVDPLAVENTNVYPTRLHQGNASKVYVTDASIGSVFIYDSGLNLENELKNLETPLGIAVNDEGDLFVGNDIGNSVGVYNPEGELLYTIDEGNIQMPNDFAFDNNWNLYVADSKSNMVKVYDADGVWLRNIGTPDNGDGNAENGELLFPSAIAISYHSGGEMYVADQGHSRVQGFDLEGNFLRTFGEPVGESSSSVWRGNFVRVQSLAFDTQGRLYAADTFMKKVQRFIFDVTTDNYIYEGHYGYYENPADEPADLIENIDLKLPLDIFILENNLVAFADAGKKQLTLTVSAVP